MVDICCVFLYFLSSPIIFLYSFLSSYFLLFYSFIPLFFSFLLFSTLLFICPISYTFHFYGNRFTLFILSFAVTLVKFFFFYLLLWVSNDFN